MEISSDDWVWVGELSGFTIELWVDGPPVIMHRCGYVKPIIAPNHYLGNLIMEYVRPHLAQGCLDKTRRAIQ